MLQQTSASMSITLNAEARAHFDEMLATATPEHRAKVEGMLANAGPSTLKMLNTDDDTSPRILANILNKSPDDFTPEERSEAEWLISEVALYSTCFDD